MRHQMRHLENRQKYSDARVVFSTLFSVFHLMMKHSVSCLMERFSYDLEMKQWRHTATRLANRTMPSPYKGFLWRENEEAMFWPFHPLADNENRFILLRYSRGTSLKYILWKTKTTDKPWFDIVQDKRHFPREKLSPFGYERQNRSC